MILIYIYIFFFCTSFPIVNFQRFCCTSKKTFFPPGPSTDRDTSLASHPMDSAYHARRRWWSHCLRWGDLPGVGWVGGWWMPGGWVVEDTQVKMATPVFFLGREKKRYTQEVEVANKNMCGVFFPL